MRNSDFYITFGQVYKVKTAHTVSAPNAFTDYMFEQDLINKELEETEGWDIAKQRVTDQKKFIKVFQDSTDIDKIKQDYKNLKVGAKNPKKTLTVPAVWVHIYEQNSLGSSVPQQVLALPIAGNLTEIPKLGQWVPIIAVSDNVISNTTTKQNVKFFYLPFSLTKRYFSVMGSVNNSKDITSGKVSSKTAKDILWPRSGATIIQNQNGKAHLISDGTTMMFSTGFGELPGGLRGDEIEQMNLHEFFRLNPPNTSDAFIFIDKYDKEWDAQLNEYRKNLYELGQFEDTSVIDSIIENLSNVKSFKDRMKLFFGIDFSDTYSNIWKSNDPQEEEDLIMDNGVVIAGENVYITSNTKSAQKDYKVARSEPIQDLLYGLIDAVKQLTLALKTHKHLGSPAMVLDPQPDFIQAVTTIEQTITQIQDGLGNISSPKVHIP